MDYPTPRYYPPSLIEWHAARQHANIALPVCLPNGNVINCHVDSWTNGEECGRIAVCAWWVVCLFVISIY